MKLSIRTKFLGAIGLILACLLGSSVYFLVKLDQVNAELERMYRIDFHDAALVSQVDGLLTRVDINILRMIAIGTPDTIAMWKKENAERFGRVDAIFGTLAGGGERGAQAPLRDLQDAYRKMQAGMTHQVALIEKGDVAGGAEVNRLEVKDNATRVFTLLAGMQHDLETTAATRFQAQKAAARTTRVVAIGMVVSIAAVAAIIGYWVVRNLLAQLGGEPDYAAAVVGNIAAGDLCADIEIRDGDRTSLLFAMASMRDSLARVIGEVHGGTGTIASAARQIASGNADLSARTEEQASALEETASSLDELTSTVTQNADNARQANQLAVTASEVAAQGGAVVADVVDTMGAINESARKIVDIISVIDGIAFQTNILALNAAVEAARAGEQGRGFAVVAAEVRNLAQRSANAAREIKILIDDSVKKVDTGSKLVHRAGSTMDDVVGAIRRVTDIMGEISTASQEQKAGIEQVGKAIAQMDHATQQNAALVEETAAGSESLRELAEKLAHAVGVFRLDGSARAPAQPTPAPAVRPTAIAASRPSGTVRAKALAGADWEAF